MPNKSKIIIIGAGIAGLAAARELVNQFDVTLLEARERAGGRVHTDHSLGVAFDLGAFIIHGFKGNPMISLADKYNALYEPLTFGKVCLESTEFISEPESDAIFEQFDELTERAKYFSYEKKADMPLKEALDAVLELTLFPALTPLNYEWRCLFASLYTGAEVNTLSARHWNEDETPYDDCHSFMRKGYQPIIDGLAKGLPIQYNCIVETIDYQGKSINVHTNQGVFKADRVLITLPLGVLKSQKVKFIPPIPTRKQSAIDRLGMGVLDKYALKFPEAFWSSECRIISAPSRKNQVGWFSNFNYKEPILIGVASADLARGLESLSDDALIDNMMKTLKGIFGENIPAPLQLKRTSWAQDPFALGSYSYIPVNSSGEDYDILGEAIDNKLFFAGEATEKRFPGTTQGAYLSGLRAALALQER